MYKIIKELTTYDIKSDIDKILYHIRKNKFDIEIKKDNTYFYLYIKNNKEKYGISYDFFGDTLRIYIESNKDLSIHLSYGEDKDYIIYKGDRYSVNNDNSKIKKIIDSIYYDIFDE